MNIEIYDILVASIIAIYDCGTLTRELLSGIMVACRGLVVGGITNRQAADGLTMEQIICKVMAPAELEQIGPCPIPTSGIEPPSVMDLLNWQREISTLCNRICREQWEVDMHGAPRRDHLEDVYVYIKDTVKSGPPYLIKIRTAKEVDQETLRILLEQGFHQSSLSATNVSDAVAYLRKKSKYFAEVIVPSITIELDG